MVRYEDPAFQASMKIKLDVSNMMEEILGEKGFRAEQSASVYGPGVVG